MQRLPILFSLLLMSLLTTTLFGQQTSPKNQILEELNSDQPGKGRVKVYEDERISGVLGRSMAPARNVYTSADGSTQYYKMRGYKIQAFSGNNQRTSRNEATRKQHQIRNAFPQHETVVMFESPFWRLRVGNFEKRQEAAEVMQEIRRTFPSFGKEMYIVVDEVKIPVQSTPSGEE